MPSLPADDLPARLDRALEIVRATPGIDAYEVRAEAHEDQRFSLRDGALAGSRAIGTSGIGYRVFAGGGSAYAHTPEGSTGSLRAALDRALRLARSHGRTAWRKHAPALATARRAAYSPAGGIDPAGVVPLLRRAEEAAKGAGCERVQTSFGWRSGRSLLADSAGSWCDVSSLHSTLLVNAVVRADGRLGEGIAWLGGERGLGDFEERGGPERLGAEAAARAKESLAAVSFPSGRYRVLCDTELTGTLAHESFGHLTEHDLVASGWSTLQGRRGETLAIPQISITDAPVVPKREGVAVPFDAEGMRGAPVKLLDRGVLTAWMHTRDSAASEGDAAAGNARALDERFPPIVRMRNTFVEPGDHDVEEALQALGSGLYLIGARGGAPRSDGSFMYTSVRGYLVERGEIVKPVRGTSIHGNVLDFLSKVEAVGSDFEVHANYFGGCGKGDQSFLHVGVGGPHLVVRDALVGGSA